jgi:hypothetical protein
VSPSFRVVAVVSEPEYILRRFVGWYLAQGAAGVTLYFDNPDDPALPSLSAIPKVDAIPCTRAFWQELGEDPDTRFTARQNSALTHGYRHASEDWVLIVDADELAWREAGLAPLLAAQAPDTLSLMIQPAEFALNGGDGVTFRLPISRAAVNAVYGELSDIFRKRRGLIGHSTGKSFHRGGHSDLRLRQHWAVTEDGAAVPYAVAGPSEGAYLLHYLSPDYASWRAKLEWRLASSGYHAGIHALVDALRQDSTDPETAYLRLFDTMHRLDDALCDRLRAAGGLLELPAGFAPPVPV